MKPVKVIITLFFFILLTIIAFGQGKEEVYGGRYPDPIKTVEIYPNPATDFVNLKFEQPVANKVKLTLHNVIGNSLELESEILSDHEIKVRVKDYPTGYYLISVKDDRLSSAGTFKFLKR